MTLAEASAAQPPTGLLGSDKGTFRPNPLIILVSGRPGLPSGDKSGDKRPISAPIRPFPASRA